MFKLTNKKVGKLSDGGFTVCVPATADYTTAPLSCDPAAREVSSTFMRWTGSERRPKSLHMKESMFALLPLNGLSRTEGREKQKIFL